MNWDTVALLISAFSGIELLRFFAERKIRKRQSEFQTLEEMIQFLQQELKESVQRVAEMFDQITDLNSGLLEAEKINSGLKLELQSKRCDKLACRHRQPPNEYTPPDDSNDDLIADPPVHDRKKIPSLPDRIDFTRQ